MLRNINNFLNIIKSKRVKPTLSKNDLILIGTKTGVNKSEYQDTAITFGDLQAQITANSTQGLAGQNGAQGSKGLQGIQGLPGAIGAAELKFKSNWDKNQSYAKNDVVFFNSSSYVCINVVKENSSDPAIDTDNWNFLALQGLQGPQGVPGSGFTTSIANRSGTNVSTGQVRLNSILIPANTFTEGSAWSYKAIFAKLKNGGIFTIKIYLSNNANLSGAENVNWFNIQNYKMNSASSTMTIGRDYYITNTGTFSQNNDTANDNGPYFQSGSVVSNYVIDWTVDQYLVITGLNPAGAEFEAFSLGAKIY